VIEKCGLLAVPRTVAVSRDVLPVHCACLSFSPTAGSSAFTLQLSIKSCHLLYCIVFVHHSSNPYKAYTYRILNLSYIETIMENYELQL